MLHRKDIEDREARLALAKQLAAESFVLLENRDHLLPLQPGKAAFFGEGAYRLVIGGSGSGASRKTERVTSITEACAMQGIVNVTALQNYYEEALAGIVRMDPIEAFFANGGADSGLIASGAIYELFGQYCGKEPELLPPAELLAQAAGETDTAVLVISRATGGEECDRHLKDDYLLLDSERELLAQLDARFAHIAVLLNVNGQINLSWISSYKNIQSVLFIGAPGEMGGYAVADVLTGKVTPCGKLAFTIAKSYEDYPTADTFSFDKEHPEKIREYRDYGLSAEDNGSVGFAKSPVTLYREGLYMGYRYFDSFGKDVQYPFGYGLSYADFSIENCCVHVTPTGFWVYAEVKNCSDRYSGKEVVQIYVSKPQTEIEKPYQDYVGSKKTHLLRPGERTVVSLKVNYSDITSYDEEQSAWVLEKGEYFIRVGNSSRNTHIVECLDLWYPMNFNQAHPVLGLQKANAGKMEFLSAKGVTPITYEGEAEERRLASDESIVLKEFDCFHEGESQPDEKCMELASRMSLEELTVLLNGYGPGLPFGGLGSENPPTIYYEDGTPIGTNSHPAGGYGYVSAALEKYGIRSIYYKDGPASVGETAWPTGMLLACSFDSQLQYAFGAACGYEAWKQQVDVWLAPALNLHRNPLGGRNFEYFSEDPIVAGSCGVQICLGAMEQNPITACPKHFALNEQETYRRGSSRLYYDAVDSIVTERTARELYLKPFEMVVRQTSVRTLMTSFNKINGTFAAGNADLCTTILRDEWGYQGFVVTDWGDMDQVVDGADAVAAGNDVVMPGGPPVIAQMRKGYEEGRVTIEQLKVAAERIVSGLH